VIAEEEDYLVKVPIRKNSFPYNTSVLEIQVEAYSNTASFSVPVGYSTYGVLESEVIPIRIPNINNCSPLYSTKKPVFPPLSNKKIAVGERDSEIEAQRQKGKALAKDQLGAQIDTLLSKLYPAPNIP